MTPREALDHDLHFLESDAELLARFVPIMTEHDTARLRALACRLEQMAMRKQVAA